MVLLWIATITAAAATTNTTATSVCPDEGAAVEACLLDQNNETDDALSAACDACLVSVTQSPPPFFDGAKNCPNLTESICYYASTQCQTECGPCHDEWSRALICAMNTILSQHPVPEVRLCVPMDCSNNNNKNNSSGESGKWSIIVTIATTAWLLIGAAPNYTFSWKIGIRFVP
jgi:hypothetical protein